MELSQLHYFHVIAQYENITRAASELHISQPSLSSTLLRLERELGYPLFDRRGRKLRLNEQGRRFWEYTRQILSLVTQIKLPSPPRTSTGKISIAFQNNNDMFFSRICQFNKEHPQIQLYLYQSSLSESFSVTAFDFILSTSRHSFPCEMNSLFFSPRHWFAVVPRSSELSTLSEISAVQLQDQPFCFLQDNHGNMEDSYRFCLNQHFIPRSIITTNSSLFKRQLLAEGNLYGFIPSGWHPSYSALDKIRLIPLKGMDQDSEIRLYWKENEPLSPAARQFLTFLSSSFAPNEK